MSGENYDDQMQLRKVSLLELHQTSIILDLEVQDVMPELLENLILDHVDKQRVEHEKTYEDRAAVLINIIKQKAASGNSDALPVFINSLKEKYVWLYSKLTEDELDFKIPKILSSKTETRIDKQKIKATLEAGGVQCLPRFAVDRPEHVENIQTELKSLKRKQYLVLTGMAGCGKTVVAMQALHSPILVAEVFKDGIFWLPIGKECSEAKDAILAKMRTLCDRVGETKAPNSLENGAELLRTAFMRRPDSLLILDDVWRSEVIKAFDIGCRILVTTRDMSVIDNVSGRAKGIRIADGFTENESLELFSKSLETTVEELPLEASYIHSECKGSPMVISLISALFHDHDITDTGRWNHYLTSLRKRKYSQMRRIRDYEHESVIDAISLSIESLDAKDREYYFDFALFQDDVGIPCPVLMVLWNLGKYEVEDLMNRLVRKSLAVVEYDPQLKCRIYSVHDLQLDYLKYQMHCDGGSEEKLHEKLIEQYLQKFENKFERFPDDGYIYFYLGYHLYKAHKTNYFPELYLNLLFIGEKMRIAGTADLLVDLRKYRDFIIGDDNKEENLELLEEITTFAQSVGHRMYNQSDVDIVQLALEMPHMPKIYHQAKEKARREPNRFYIEWSNAASNKWKNPEAVVLCSDNVRCIKFVGLSGNHFLAALSNGFIELCDFESCQIYYHYTGHTNLVHALDVFHCRSNDKLIFLSASEDKSCKLWDLKTAFEKINATQIDHSTDSSPSPKLLKDSWPFDKDDSYLTFEFHTAPVLYAEFSFDGSQVISTSLNEILIWTSKNGQIIQKISPDLPSSPNITMQACYFPRQREPSNVPCLLMSCENQVVLYSRDMSSIYSAIEGHHMKIISLLQLPNDAFCTVSENEIGLWKIIYGKTPPRSRSLSPRKSFAFTNLSSTNQITGRTQIDALPIEQPSRDFSGEKIYQAGELLRPTDLNSRNSSYSSGRGSPPPTSDCYSPAIVHTSINTGNDFVKIIREDVLQKKTTGLFQCAAVTDSGELLACGTSDRRVILWNLQDRNYLGEFSSHTGTLRCLDFSKVDILTLLSGSEDHTVMLWDLTEEQKGRKEPQKNLLFTSVFIDSINLNGHFISLFTTDINSVQVYKDSKLILATDPLKVSTITAVALYKDGKVGFIGTKSGNLYKFEINFLAATTTYSDKDFVLVESIENSKITHLLFNEDGSNLVAATANGDVLVFNNLKLFRRIKTDCESIVSLHFHEMVLAIVCREDVIVWVENLKSAQRLKGWKTVGEIRINCSTATGSTLALGTARNGVFMFEVESSSGLVKPSQIICRHNTSIRSLQFSQDKSRLAVGHDSGLITVWKFNFDSYEEELDLILHKKRVRCLRFSPDGNWLASCGDKLAFWTFEKPTDRLLKPSFMAERRRKKSGDSSSRPNSRLSLEIGEGIKIGRKGKRELLQTFFFYGAYAQSFFVDPYFKRFVSLDDSGIFYLLEEMPTTIVA